MFNFYFEGHNFEYESRNALRVFDLNIEYTIKGKKDLLYNQGLGLVSKLEMYDDRFIAYATLYKNKELLFSSIINSDDICLEKYDEKKLKKTVVKKSIHGVLKKYYNINPPYGILTGIRPVKIVFTCKNSGKSDNDIYNILKDTYEVSNDKIKLLQEVSKIEEKYINKEINKQNYNLYIGIPFCPSKCTYCSFTSYINNERNIDNYLPILLYEIEETIKLALQNKLNLNSVYIGGGTPSVLNSNQIKTIFDLIKKYYDLSNVKEITFEAGRPDTITREKLQLLKDNFVNRISINPQTMNDKTLKTIGRNHSVEDIIAKYKMAKQIGFSSINMDIILGLPDETEEDAQNTIEEIIKLNPDNITVHSLTYKTGSSFKNTNKNQLTKDYKLLQNMHEVVKEKCNKNNYKPYYMYRQKNIKGNLENIGYTITNKESIYNIVIIEEVETILACGIGASSKIMIDENHHETIHNLKGLREYNDRIKEIIEKKKDILK